MKQILMGITALAFSIFFAGCLEINVHTTVAPNGASDRTVRIKNDKQDLSGIAFPRPDDPSWAISREESTSDGKKQYILTAKKHFADPEALAREYTQRPDTTTLRVGVTLKKSFGWFYTYFDYTESYHFNNPYGTTPVSSVMTPQEVEQFMRNDDAPELKAKYEEWELREKVDGIFNALLDTVSKRADGQALVDSLKLHKEALVQLVLHMDDKDTSKKVQHTKENQTADTTIDGDVELSDLILRKIVLTTGVDAMGTLRGETNFAFENVRERDRKWSSIGDGYTNTVELPGILLESNSDDAKGNSVSWKYTGKQIRVHDIAMHASSRVANVWAFIATGIGVLLLIMISAFSFVRRRS